MILKKLLLRIFYWSYNESAENLILGFYGLVTIAIREAGETDTLMSTQVFRTHRMTRLIALRPYLQLIKLVTDHLGSCYFTFFLNEALKSKKNTACLDEYANLLNGRLFSILRESARFFRNSCGSITAMSVKKVNRQYSDQVR